MSYTSSVVLFLSVAAETCVSETLVSNGQFRRSGVMLQYLYLQYCPVFRDLTIGLIA
jgi:hypothetical protein